MDVLEMFGATAPSTESSGDESSLFEQLELSSNEDLELASTSGSSNSSSSSTSSASFTATTDGDTLQSFLIEVSEKDLISSEYQVFSEEEQEALRKQSRHAAKRKIVGQRRKRADHIRSIFAMPDLLRTCDNFQIECLGFSDEPLACLGLKRSDAYDSFADQEDRPDKVVVAVEATAICELDLNMRRGAIRRGTKPKGPFVLGSNFVGVVHHCSPMAEEIGIKPGIRVASLVERGADAKYVTARADQLITVPKKLDAAEVSALISTYLPAFQALHHGRSRPYRYSRRCLKGRKVFVTGGARLEVQAVLRLARAAGAKELYVTAPRDEFSILRKIGNVNILDDDPDEWLPVVENEMDIVIDYEFPKNLWSVYCAMSEKGRLVCINHKRSSGEKDLFSNMAKFTERYQLSLIEGATLFDFAESKELYPDEMKEDFMFLLRLLSTRQIRPRIDRYITLADIPEVHKELQKRPASNGAIICEPWKQVV